jgi:hypothetical protein
MTRRLSLEPGDAAMDQMRLFNRREHDRFRLQPMYTNVLAKSLDGETAAVNGHAYDISETGVRIELDDALPIGHAVNLEIDLCGGETGVAAQAKVVWINDADDDPGPRRMALRFTAFRSAADHDRLVGYLGRGLQRVAA